MQISTDSAGQIALLLTADELSMLSACTLWLHHLPPEDQKTIHKLALKGFDNQHLLQIMSREEAHVFVRWLEFGLGLILDPEDRRRVEGVIQAIAAKLIYH
jgi:hypothetical protein